MNWTFPLPRPHTGVMQGNGRTGLLIWGCGNVIKITVGRADLWDHRGGMPWTAKQNYNDIFRCLKNNDKKGLASIFECKTEHTPGQPPRPSVLPFGRVELILPESSVLISAELDLASSFVSVTYRRGRRTHSAKIILSALRDSFICSFEKNEDVHVKCIRAFDIIGEDLRRISFEKPIELKNPNGWIQKLPADPAIGLAYGIDENNTVGFVIDRDNDTAVLAEKLKTSLAALKPEKIEKETASWWQKYWRRVPKITLYNKRIETIYSYGLYRFGAYANPEGETPGTLQGPWIEEHRMPPWSSDYHFNINVQMCYAPALKGNHHEFLMPLFDMVFSWRDTLRNNAKNFIGIDNGYMLPHAVDDRCVCMGAFWTGTVDHGCTAWVAMMMYQYYLYSGDISFLREKAFDFMQGTFNVYYAMLEKRNGKYVLSLSVSPEYRGAEMNAWGTNASFQLAAFHRLCEDLTAAAGKLGIAKDARWADVASKLPKVSLFGDKGEEVIGLWDGTNLEESHRHHSHLASITPFDTIDIYDKDWRGVVDRTFNWWTCKGMGLWSGWCMPWASALQTRLGNGRMAELILEIWERVFTNKGHGTLHDTDFPGFSLLGGRKPTDPNQDKFIAPERPFEVMQIDAGMGAVSAVQDMLLHSKRGVQYIFAGVSPLWDNAEFSNMPCEDGAVFSGKFAFGAVAELTVSATRDTVVRIASPFPAGTVIKPRCSTRRRICRDRIIELEMAAGDAYICTPVE